MGNVQDHISDKPSSKFLFEKYLGMIAKAILWVVTLNARQKNRGFFIKQYGAMECSLKDQKYDYVGSRQEVRHEKESYGLHI